MDSSTFDAARQAMLEQLVGHGIRSPRVLTAMGRVPRERFVPQEIVDYAYADRAAPIGCEQTISQPYMVALMTEALSLTGTERVLEVGTGSGYQTAVLAELAPSVVSVERHPELSARAGELLKELGYENVELHVGDGTQGWPEGAPFDRIIITAAARKAPPQLVEQLAEGGIMVVPIGEREHQTLAVLHKQAGQLHAQWLASCRFVPLVGDDGEMEPDAQA